MTIEEIRKNAPDGATHYDDYGGYYKVSFFTYKWMGEWSCDWHILMHEPYFKLKPL